MFEREVTARRLFRNDKKRQTVRSTPADTLQTVDFVRCYVVSSGVYAMLRAIPCPNVAWSGVELHLECVGPSIILLCKYLHKETGLLPLAKTRESSRGTLFFNTIYSYGERECQERQRRGKKGHCGTRNQKKVVDGHAKKKKTKTQEQSDRWRNRIWGTERKRWQRGEEENRAICDVMSLCGLH